MLQLHYYLLLLDKISCLAQSPRLLDQVRLLQCWHQPHWWHQQDWSEELHSVLHWKLPAHGPQKVSSGSVIVFVNSSGGTVWARCFVFAMKHCFNKPALVRLHRTHGFPFPSPFQYHVSSTHCRVGAPGGWTSGSNWWGNGQCLWNDLVSLTPKSGVCPKTVVYSCMYPRLLTSMSETVLKLPTRH